jgi:hypothetical protein
MSNTLDKAIEMMKTPKQVYCPECQEELFSPIDKLAIALYGKCTSHDLEEHQENNLFTIIEGVL